MKMTVGRKRGENEVQRLIFSKLLGVACSLLTIYLVATKASRKIRYAGFSTNFEFSLPYFSTSKN